MKKVITSCPSDLQQRVDGIQIYFLQELSWLKNSEAVTSYARYILSELYDFLGSLNLSNFIYDEKTEKYVLAKELEK